MNFFGKNFVLEKKQNRILKFRFVFLHIRTDAEKCLQVMVENVTLPKALQALIAGGAR